MGSNDNLWSQLAGQFNQQAQGAAQGLSQAMMGLNQIPQANANIAGMQSQMGLFSQNTSTPPPAAYPTYPNSGGIGSQQVGAAQGPSNPSSGLNPWSLSGEANSRGA